MEETPLFQEKSFQKEVFKEEVIKAFHRRRSEDSSIIKLSEDELVRTMLMVRLENGQELTVTSKQLKHQIKTNRNSFIALADDGNTPIIPIRTGADPIHPFGGTILYYVMFLKNSLTEKERLNMYELLILENQFKDRQADKFIGARDRYCEKALGLGVSKEQLSLTA